jgi:hypothetical protein
MVVKILKLFGLIEKLEFQRASPISPYEMQFREAKSVNRGMDPSIISSITSYIIPLYGDSSNFY